MSGNLLQQETQIRASLVADRDDTVVPSEANYETNAVSLLDDINNICSRLSSLLDVQVGNWFDPLAVPSAFDAGIARGVNNLNADLHALERQRHVVPRKLLVDVAVGAPDNFVIIGAGQIPTQNIAAVGNVTTLGTVVAEHAGTFGAHSLDEIPGAHALAPVNLVEISDSAGDPILSSGRRVWGLLQSESGVDGHTIDTVSNRIQISFVRPNATHTDLEACPVADIQGAIRYCSGVRLPLSGLTQQDISSGGASIDIGAGAAAVNRQASYDNQGSTPVDLTTDASLDLEGPGLAWRIRDDLEATLFEIVEGSAGGASQVNVSADVDEYDNDASTVDFAQGASIASSKTRPISIGVNDGLVESTAGDLELKAASALRLNDANMVSEATWAGPGVAVSLSAAEVAAYETAFGGEVSLMNALVQAVNSANYRRVFAVVTANLAAGVSVSGPSGDNNLDADLGDLSGGIFTEDYDLQHNGAYLRPDASAAGPGDLYPGASLANGQLIFNRKLKSGDTLALISRAT